MSTVRNTRLGGIVTDGLVLNLDAARKDSYPRSGTAWNDLSSSNNNGTLVGSPLFDDERFGIIFDGVNDYGNLGNDTSLQFSNGFTIEMFIEFNGILNSHILTKRDTYNANVSYALLQVTTPGKVGMQTSSNGTAYFTLNSTSTFTTGVIYCITAVYDQSANRKELWVNGVLDVTGATHGNLYNSTQNVYIAADGRINIVTGPQDVYTVKMYNIGLTPAEILKNYNAMKNRYL